MRLLFITIRIILISSLSVWLTACGGSGDTTENSSVQNSAPIANAGIDRSVVTGMVAVLDGSNSLDADGDNLSCQWIFDSRPPLSMTSLFSTRRDQPLFYT